MTVADCLSPRPSCRSGYLSLSRSERAADRPRRAVLASLACGALALAGWPRPGQAQPRLEPVGPTLADKGSAHYRFERLDFISADGRRRYRVVCAVPRLPPPPAGYPTVYLLDGNAVLQALDENLLAGLAASGRPPLLVMVGYETPLPFDRVGRSHDFTPTLDLGDGRATGDVDPVSGLAIGGADDFLAFLLDPIAAAVVRLAPVDDSRRTLWGHSFGGLFVLWVLLSRPEVFTSYVAADPSLWWHDGILLELEADARPLPPAGRQLLVIAGGDREEGAPPRAETVRRSDVDPGLVDRMRAARRSLPAEALIDFVIRQSRRPGLAVSLELFEGMAHGPLFAAAIGPGLDFAVSVDGRER